LRSPFPQTERTRAVLYDPVKELLKKILAHVDDAGNVLDEPIEISVKPSLITTDPRLQIRRSEDEGLIDDLAEIYGKNKEPDGKPPVLIHDGSTVWLCDGHHRLKAAIQAGKKKLKTLIRRGTFRDALAESLRANATHGLARTVADKRHAVEMALADEEWSKWTNGRVAGLCGVSDEFVRKVRSELEDQSPTVGDSGKRVGRDGKEYSAKGQPKNGRRSDEDSAPVPDADPNENTEGAEPDVAPALPAPDRDPDMEARDLKPLPEWLEATIRDGRELQSRCVANLADLLESIREYTAKPCGKKVSPRSIQHVEAFREDLRFSKPRAICPYCLAEDSELKTCPHCKASGWITETTYKDVLSDKQKAVCDEYDYEGCL
jgi:ParB-like chromosome segregation protein Spo0J